MLLDYPIGLQPRLNTSPRQVKGSLAANAGATVVLSLDIKPNEMLYVDAVIKASAGNNKTAAVTSINTTNEQITATAHGFVTGTPCIVTASVLPTGVSAGTVYYLNRIDDNTLYLYDTQANAVTGGATGRVDITAAGTAVVINGTVLQAFYRIKGVARHRVNTVSAVGTADKEALEDVAGWDANFVANNTAKTLDITVTPDTVLATRYDIVAIVLADSTDS